MTDTDSAAIIVRPSVLPSTSQFQMMRELAERLSYAEGFLPKHFFAGDPRTRPHRVLAAIEYGRAVGIEPMIALQNITMIDGKAGASALLIGALLRRGGYDLQAEYAASDQSCTVTISKAGKLTGRGYFSMEDARRAGLVRDGSGWTKYPRDMLYARALTQAARQGAQDAVLGMAYTSEELGVEVNEDGQFTGEIPLAQASPETVAALTTETIRAQTSVEVPPPTTEDPRPAANAATVGQTPEVGDPARGSGGPPQTATRRSGRSVGPTPKRQNVVTVEQGATAGKAATEAARQSPAPDGPGEPVLAPPDLIQEPVSAAPDDGLAPHRELLRQAAAELAHVNAILFNKVTAPLEGKALVPVPPTTPSDASAEGLARLIDRDYPGRTVAELDAAGLQNRLELIESNLAKKRRLMSERGISDD